MTAAKLRQFLSLGAAAGVLASSAYLAAPAGATGEPGTGTSSGSTTDGSALPATALSEAALADAVQRDLGVTPEEFTAAGELGAQAAAVAVQLRDVPGYVGIRLEAGQIVVSGSGSELLGKVAALAATTPELAVEAPSPAPALEVKAEASGAAADPAPAPSSTPAEGSELAVSAEQLFQAYVRDVGPQSLQAVMASGGKFVIRTGGINSPESTGDPGAGSAESAGPGKLSPAAFVARYANVELDAGAPLAPEADVPGGVGYRTDRFFTCSTGFSAFDPSGLPAFLTAGHCTEDGAANAADLLLQGERAGTLGTFEFSQFGGPGNSPVLNPDSPIGPGNEALTDPGNVGTDIAVIGAIRPDLDPLPAASTHGHTSQPGPDVKIIGTATPVVGMPVCRSGWRTGWSCGTVSAVGIFLVGGPTYPGNSKDVRAFNGFLSYDVQSSGGDSGGPYLSGNYAVGTHAAGDTPDENGNVIENFAVGATLGDSLAVLPGYELELFLNKPAVTAPAPGATYEPGQLVNGTVPAAPASAVAAGSKVRITVQGEDPFEVPVDDAGNWTFPAPEGNGALKFTAETVNGFSVSGAGSFEFAPAATESPAPTASPEPTPAGPVPASPAHPLDGAAVVVNPPASSPPADLADTGARRNVPAHTGGLAYTGATALLPAAAAAAAAIAVGGVLMALVRRRKRRAAE